MVVDRLAGLNVNLPAVRNAASFDYYVTQILAGAKAFGVANQVRGHTRPRRRPDGQRAARHDGGRHRRQRPQGKGSAVAASEQNERALSLVQKAVRLAAAKKALDAVVLDMAEAVGYTDYFVIVQRRQHPSDQGDRRRRERGPARPGRARRPRRRSARSRMDPPRLPRHGRARLHAGRARLLPARSTLA